MELDEFELAGTRRGLYSKLALGSAALDLQHSHDQAGIDMPPLFKKKYGWRIAIEMATITQGSPVGVFRD